MKLPSGECRTSNWWLVNIGSTTLSTGVTVSCSQAPCMSYERHHTPKRHSNGVPVTYITHWLWYKCLMHCHVKILPCHDSSIMCKIVPRSTCISTNLGKVSGIFINYIYFPNSKATVRLLWCTKGMVFYFVFWRCFIILYILGTILHNMHFSSALMSNDGIVYASMHQ